MQQLQQPLRLLALAGLALALALATCAVAGTPVRCPHNASAPDQGAPLTCPAGSTCCKARHWGSNVCATGSKCNVCAECCHDELNATQCNTCAAACPKNSFGTWGCQQHGSRECCEGGQPGASESGPNCLLIGDSVAHGTFAHIMANNMSTRCTLSNIEGVAAGNENTCFWSQSTSAATGLPVKWDVIHYNEGLHSLYPHVNTTAELAAWAQQLGAWTDRLKASAHRVVYVATGERPRRSTKRQWRSTRLCTCLVRRTLRAPHGVGRAHARVVEPNEIKNIARTRF